MNIVKDFFNSQSNELISKLIGQGFMNEQASKFIPDAGNCLMNAVKELDITELCTQGTDNQVTSVLEHVDVETLAAKAGIDAGLVTSGLRGIIPELLNFIKDHAGDTSGMMSFISGDKPGGIGEFVRGLFHK